MDNWNPTVVYQMAIERHNEDMARGEAARQLADLPQRQSVRARLANALVALAARLDPAASAARQPMAAASATPA